MRIGVLGAGNVGGSLARALAARGHDVRVGVRDPASAKAREAAARSPEAPIVDLAGAAAHGEVVALAVPYEGVAELAAELAPLLEGKVVIDATNAVAWRDGPRPALAEGSAGEAVAALLPGARVVKAFNTIGAEHFVDPAFGSASAFLPVCGDDAAARETVMGLARELGFDAVDVGPLRNARLTEHLAVMWIHLATQGQGRAIAFTLARK